MHNGVERPALLLTHRQCRVNLGDVAGPRVERSIRPNRERQNVDVELVLEWRHAVVRDYVNDASGRGIEGVILSGGYGGERSWRLVEQRPSAAFRIDLIDHAFRRCGSVDVSAGADCDSGNALLGRIE